MVRLLILLIIFAITFAIGFFRFKSIPMMKKMTVLAGGFIAAVIGILMQLKMPFYMALLSIVAISLLISLVYMKRLEKEELEKQQQVEERKAARQHLSQPSTKEREPNMIHENTINKSFGMQSIDPDRKEH